MAGVPKTVMPKVPFGGTLYPTDDPKKRRPNAGDQVKAIKIAVSRFGFWPWPEFNNLMNPAFAHGVGRKVGTSGLAGAQKALGIAPTGIYGAKTHAALVKARVPKGHPHHGEPVFDAHSIALYTGGDPLDHASKLVASAFSWWDWMVAHTGQIGYSQARAMQELARHLKPPVLPFDEDCSSTFIYCAFLAGAKSPDIAYGFSGFGNTDSLVRCGQLISEADISKWCRTHYVGAFYGASHWDTHHVAAVKSQSEVYSMGREQAPERWSSVHNDPGLIEIRAYEVI